MIKLLLSGCNGRMGRTITEMVENCDGISILAGVDINLSKQNVFPTYTDILEYSGDIDVIVDFSHFSALPKLTEYAISRKLPLVLATTGYDKECMNIVRAASEKIPVFQSANMSVGVNLLTDLVRRAEKVLGKAYDVEIVEKHHNQKLDAPSGTALILADAVSAEMANRAEYIYDRHSVHKKRGNNEIGISSIRGGSIVGEHDVMFIGATETITLSHSAFTRDVFATGALRAAEYMSGMKAPGLYTMTDLINSL